MNEIATDLKEECVNECRELRRKERGAERERRRRERQRKETEGEGREEESAKVGIENPSI